MKNVFIVDGDIVTFEGDAIVNAANENLHWGGGVCGAIFRAAGGNKLQEECKKYSPIRTGEAVITKGYKLKAKYIIHAVGPDWRDCPKDEAIYLLDKCYHSLFEVALKNNIKTIALCSISTSIYRFPHSLVVPIALKVINEYKDNFDGIYIYLRNKETYDLYQEEIKKYQ